MSLQVTKIYRLTISSSLKPELPLVHPIEQRPSLFLRLEKLGPTPPQIGEAFLVYVLPPVPRCSG